MVFPGAQRGLVSSPGRSFPPAQMLDGSEALQTEGAAGWHQEGSDTEEAGGMNISQERSPTLTPSSLSECVQAPLPALSPLHSSYCPRVSRRTRGAFLGPARPPLTGLFGGNTRPGAGQTWGRTTLLYSNLHILALSEVHRHRCPWLHAESTDAASPTVRLLP